MEEPFTGELGITHDLPCGCKVRSVPAEETSLCPMHAEEARRQPALRSSEWTSAENRQIVLLEEQNRLLREMSGLLRGMAARHFTR